jgi:type VI secretion system protein ImpJ
MAVHTQPTVLWREGMFLCPQHLQAYAREIGARIHTSESIGRVGNWGTLRAEIDAECLARDVFRLVRGEVLFPDGTLAAFPENAEVAQRDFAPSFTGPELDVYIGIPGHQPGVAALADGPTGRGRFRSQVVELFDENEREAPREIETRILMARFFFGDEDRTGHECVPLARLVRRGRPVAVSALSETYIPPVLTCGASSVLMGRLRDLASQVRAQGRDLAARLPAAAALSSVDRGADLAGFVKLQAVNQCIPPLEQLIALPDVHPFPAFMALAQAVGNLAIFGDDRTVPELPTYVHDDLDTCFTQIIDAVQALIPAQVTVPYDLVAFTKDPLREGFFRGDIPAEWTKRDPLLYLGVQFAKPGVEVATLVANGVKLLAEADLDRVLQGVVPGIGLEYVRTPPLAFPKRPDLHFFRVSNEGDSRAGWLKVLAVRSAVLLTALGGLGAEFHFYVELR